LLTGEDETGESGAVVAFVAGYDLQRTERLPMTKKEIAEKISEQSGITHVLAWKRCKWCSTGSWRR
jgi:hypothetical protein